MYILDILYPFACISVTLKFYINEYPLKESLITSTLFWISNIFNRTKYRGQNVVKFLDVIFFFYEILIIVP